MEDVRRNRGADTVSPKQFVVAKVKLKHIKHCITIQTTLQGFNTAFFRDTTKLKEFKIALNSGAQALQVEGRKTTSPNSWKDAKEALTSKCWKVLNSE